MSPRFVDPHHALLSGMVVGVLEAQGLDAVPELAPDDERRPGDDYLPVCLVTFEGRQWRVSTEPLGPEGKPASDHLRARFERARFEQDLENEQVRRLRQEGRCPVCGADA